MADYKSDSSDLITGFAAASSPKSDLKNDEPVYALSIQVHSADYVAANASAPPFSEAPSPSAPPYVEIDFRIAAAPVPTAFPVGAKLKHSGQWSANLCDCFDSCVPNCCMTAFCPCVSAAQIASRVGFDYWKVLFVIGTITVVDVCLFFMAGTTVDGESSYFSDGKYTYAKISNSDFTGWIYAALPLSLVPLSAYWFLRARVRDTYMVAGGCVDDCCTTFFCACCVLAQMATHVKSYKPGSCSFGPPDELPAYDETC